MISPPTNNTIQKLTKRPKTKSPEAIQIRSDNKIQEISSQIRTCLAILLGKPLVLIVTMQIHLIVSKKGSC